jgi:hypothetical protein
MRWSEAGYLSRIVLAHAPRQVSVSLILGVRRKKTMKVSPKGGWKGFSRGKELIDVVFDLYLKHGWHYIGPTSDTMILEAPKSGSMIYLEVNGEVVLDMVMNEESDAEAELKVLSQFVRDEFGLTETE